MRSSGQHRRVAPVFAFVCAGLLISLASGSAWAGEEARAGRAGLAALLGSEEAADFIKAVEPRTFVFPADHGPHPAYRNEWWYMTGNLDGDGGRRFGFELTIFRFSLTPKPPVRDSAWRTNQVYIAHFAVTDVQGKRFYAAERSARGAVGLAGAQAQPFRVWIDTWSIAARANTTPERWVLRADDDDFGIELTLSAEKPPALNGNAGLSRKSSQAGNASYYYSMPRWRSEGRVRVGTEEHAVTGLAWLDREWSSSALASDQAGWDWFALQLSDGSDLMFYALRRTDGRRDKYSAGTLIAADGSTRAIASDEAEISVLDFWESPKGGRYPAGWLLRLPDYELELSITPVLDNQELSTIVRYWEGAVDVSGRRAGQALSGRGYVELTGYAD